MKQKVNFRCQKMKDYLESKEEIRGKVRSAKNFNYFEQYEKIILKGYATEML